MRIIIKILSILLFIEILFLLYVKFFDTKKSYHNTSPLINKQITNKAPVLPQSSEYTLWDPEVIKKLNKKIETFHHKITNRIKTNKETNKQAIVQTRKEPIKKISLSKKIEQYAKEKLGQKYVWGATGPLTFDCSGFTQDVFSSTAGIKIPRVSRHQAKIGEKVKYEELKLGDMVFFDTEKKYSGKVNHVGIYLNNESFIHASSAKKKIIITSFRKKPFYKKRFLWGRRVIKNPS